HRRSVCGGASASQSLTRTSAARTARSVSVGSHAQRRTVTQSALGRGVLMSPTALCMRLPTTWVNDFAPISPVTSQDYLIVAKKTFPADDLTGLIAWLKANPDKASAATQGVGGTSHISGILFQNVTGTRFQFVPYRGGAPAMQDLVAGQVDFMIASPGDALEQVRAGRIKAFAITAKSRLAAAPEIPTIDEAGLAGLYFSIWFALWAPKR